MVGIGVWYNTDVYKGKKVSLILPAYNEEESIVKVIGDFAKTGVCDEIIVVDNNSKDNTSKLAKLTRLAKVVKEKKQGYGFAIQKGLAVSRGDILVTCDADNTYRAKDIRRLLNQSLKVDFVFANRVCKRYVLMGSNMGYLRRSANIFISKLIQFLFKGSDLNDLGSTFRVLNRKPYERIKDQFTVGGGYFQPELTMLALLNGFSIREVPVYYGPRTGISKISGSIVGGVKTAKNMLILIISYRLSTWKRQLRTLK